MTGRLDYPWAINTRELQLEWWKRYGSEILMHDATAEPTIRRVTHDRPPDEFRYVGEETYRGERVERRHTTFKTWPVKVVTRTVWDLLGLFWQLEDGRKVALKVKVNERQYTHEEEVAGA